MKKRFLIWSALFGWFVLANGANAQQTMPTVLEEYDYVKKVNVGEDNHLYIAVRGNFTLEHKCSNRAYVKSQFSLSDDRTKAWLQMAMASFLSRSKVHIWTRDCTGNLVIAGLGKSGYPVMVKMQVSQ